MSGFGRRGQRQKRILVTGGGGFIGSHTCERLVADGCRVWSLDNYDPACGARDRRANLDEVRADPDLHVVEGDVRDAVLLDGLMRDVGFDCVIHLAAMSGEVTSMTDPRGCFDVNVNGTLSVLESMRRNQVTHAILASTGQVDEPLSAYAASKRASELVGQVYARRYGLSVYSLRIRAVYGPRQREDHWLCHLAGSILAGEQIMLSRDDGFGLTFVDDMVDALTNAAHAVQKTGRGGCFEVFEVGNSEPVLAPDLVRALGRHIGTRARVRMRPARTDSVASSPPAASEISAGIDFAARTDLETGLGRFAAWYQEYAVAVSQTARSAGSESRTEP